MRLLAEELFEQDIALSLVEQKVSNLLDEIYGASKWADFTTDYYDKSIEIYDCMPSAAAFDRLRAVGFERIWQHKHPKDNEPCLRGCSGRPS